MKSQNLLVLVTFVIGMIIILELFLPLEILDTMSAELQNWAVIISAFALGLAAVNLFRIHGRRILLKKGEWWNSAFLLFFMCYMIIMGVAQGTESVPYDFAFQNILSPLGSTMYSMLAFWIASAAYRAFTARSVEAGILLVCATITMLANAPIGEAIWKDFPALGAWIRAIPNNAAMRGIMIGSAVGAIALGIRILIGIERGYLGSGEE